MHILPIVTREFRVISRAPATYRARVVAAAIAAGVGAWLLFALQFARVGGFTGAGGFSTLTGLLFWFCLASGVRITADSVSVEKRNDTLGFLFLTRLRGIDVVLGKFTAASLEAFYRLLAVVPVLALFIPLGGVTGLALLKSAASLLNILFFSSAMGILVSTFGRDQRRNEIAATLAVLGFVFAPLILSAIRAAYPSIAIPLVVFDAARFSSPAAGALSFMGMGGQTPWTSLAVSHAWGWLFLAVAAWRIPSQVQRRPAMGRWERVLIRWRQFRFRRSTQGALFRTRMLDRNPILWLLSRNRFRGLVLAAILGAPPAVIAGFVIHAGGWEMLWSTVPLIAAVYWYFVVRIAVADESSRELAAQRASGGLESVLGTTLTVEHLLKGQRQYLRRMFWLPVLLALALGVYLPLAALADLEKEPFLGAPLTVLLLAFFMIVIFCLDLIALPWMGAWAAVTVPRVKDASGRAATHVLALPGLISLLAVTGHLIWRGYQGLGPLDAKVYLAVWFVISVTTDIALLVVFPRAVRSGFRRMALIPMADRKSKRGRLARLFGAAPPPSR